jgi:hypothetical protein
MRTDLKADEAQFVHASFHFLQKGAVQIQAVKNDSTSTANSGAFIGRVPSATKRRRFSPTTFAR